MDGGEWTQIEDSYFLVYMVIFHCHVRLPEDTFSITVNRGSHASVAIRDEESGDFKPVKLGSQDDLYLYTLHPAVTNGIITFLVVNLQIFVFATGILGRG